MQLKGEKEVQVSKLSLKHKVGWSKAVKKLDKDQAKDFQESALRAEVELEEEKPEAKKKKKKKSLGPVGALGSSRKRFLPATDFVAAKTKTHAKRPCMRAPQKGESSLKLRLGMLSAGLQTRFGYLCAEESQV